LTSAIPDILKRIVARKHEELAEKRAPLDAVKRERRDFAKALLANRPAVIAEVKQASPSKGVLASDFDPVRTARQYEAGGAAAISVLTDRDFFRGSLADLERARAAVTVPVLRKDFTIDEYHVREAAFHGADAILLIAAILDSQQLRGFRELAAAFGMAALVEVHDDNELDAALSSGAQIIGVNNRDLRTFEVRMDTSLRLAKNIPANVLKISESGIHNAADVQRLSAAGFDAFLVGEHLMKAVDPAAALRSLTCS
jgi:indole-3-glycerol phosphate synthase